LIVHTRKDGKAIHVLPDVKFTLLQNSERMMLMLVELSEGSTVPLHNHPHEQMGICLCGSAEFVSGKEVTIIREGDTYSLTGNEMHMVRNPSKGGVVFLDIFSPPREDYLAGTSDYARDEHV
jgi:quercetin dioxygenase-like cupin family protein